MKISDYINALPDAYRKDKESNNYKLLLLQQYQVQGFRDDISELDDILDLFQASGKTLDLYGSIYDQARGSLTDDQYRTIILQKAAQYRVGGDYNSTVEALANALGASTSDIVLTEKDSPRMIEVGSLPFEILQEIGITSKQAFQIIEAMLPVGIPLGPLSLDGTFEFAEFENEQDNDKGFADIDQTIGGYFGVLETGDIDIPT